MLSGVSNARMARTKPLWSSSTSVRSAAVGLLALSLSGCLTTPETVIVDDCDLFTAISYSASLDTAETVSQIRRHNARYLELCAPT
tara:strand:- start:77 stop:334 length:258 start_codon:yes stop_codon:yes gene_type:complete